MFGKFFKKGSPRREFFVSLIAGIRFMGPLAATVVIIKVISGWMNTLLGYLPASLNPQTYLPHVPGLGLMVLVLVLVALGWLTRKFTDSWILRIFDNIILAVPVLSGIYKAVKQLTDVILRNPKQEFSQVVLVPFPQKGMYSMAFVTGKTIKDLNPFAGEDYVNVFLPTTPNPTAGFYIQVPKNEIIPLDLDVEDALNTVVSAGLVAIKPKLKKTNINANSSTASKEKKHDS